MRKANVLGGVLSVLLLLGSQSASAAVYGFLGFCDAGCDGTITGRINLYNGYTNTIGDKTDNLIRFRYESSNILFDIPPEVPFDSIFQGSFFNDIPFAQALPENLSLGSEPVFQTFLDGSWFFSCTADVCGIDIEESGSGAVWQLTNVPIPAAAWLFASALLALAALKRRTH